MPPLSVHHDKKEWEQRNLTLLSGQLGFETDTGKVKRGDGSTKWNALPYFTGSLYVEPEGIGSGSGSADDGSSEADPNTAVVRDENGGFKAHFVEGLDAQTDETWGGRLARLDYVRAMGTPEKEPNSVVRRNGNGSFFANAIAGLEDLTDKEWATGDYSASKAYVDKAAGRFTPTFVALGDSITADGGFIWNNAAAREPSIYPFSWHTWAQILSDSRAEFLGVFGAAGKTVEEIHDTYLPYLLSKNLNPTYCVLLAGQNSLGSAASSIGVYVDMVDKLQAAGITPILCTLTPSFSGRATIVFDSQIRELAARRGLPLVDLTKSFTDPATGAWKTGLNRDAAHPSYFGAKQMGQQLADVLIKLIPINVTDAWLPATQVGYGDTWENGSGGFGNTLFLSEAGDGTTRPAGTWGGLTGGRSDMWSYDTPGGDVIGRRAILTSVHDNDMIDRFSLTNWCKPGDEFLLVLRLSVDVEAHGAAWCMMALQDGNGGNRPKFDIGRNTGMWFTHDVDSKLVSFRMTYDGPVDGGAIWMDIGIRGTGSSLALSQMAVYNLTALGIS